MLSGVKSAAVGITNPTQFFTILHKKYGIGTPNYVKTMTDIEGMTALRIQDSYTLGPAGAPMMNTCNHFVAVFAIAASTHLALGAHQGFNRLRSPRTH